MAENYVRPPIVALESPSARAGVWRYRITLGFLLAIIAVGIFLIAKSVIGTGEGSPDVSGQGMPVHQTAVVTR